MDLQFGFTVDKPANTISIVKEFAAGLSLVWDAFTQADILDLWGAPEPWTAKTKEMRFEEGGRRLYSMNGPQGQTHWSIQEFTVIRPKVHFTMLTNFADQDGNISSGFPSSVNNLDFSESGGITTVRIKILYAAPEILEMMVEKGFRQGFTLSMKNLEKLLETMQG